MADRRASWRRSERHHNHWRSSRQRRELDANLTTQSLHSLISAHVPRSYLHVQVSYDSYVVALEYVIPKGVIQSPDSRDE